ncbi:MAG: hypothetical protein R3B47_11670 [Bacteroidia bacterium]
MRWKAILLTSPLMDIRSNTGWITELSANQLKADFAALRHSLQLAEKEGREILSIRDWFTLSGLHGPPGYQLVSGRGQTRPRPDQNGWRVVEF